MASPFGGRTPGSRPARVLHSLRRLGWRVTRPVTVGVRLLLVHGDEVMLVRHTYLSGWYLPGGGVHRGESIEDAARREAAEELGAQLGRLTLHGLYFNRFEHKSDHVAVLHCDDFEIHAANSPEIDATAFYRHSELPLDTSPGTVRRIDEWVRGEHGLLRRW